MNPAFDVLATGTDTLLPVLEVIVRALPDAAHREVRGHIDLCARGDKAIQLGLVGGRHEPASAGCGLTMVVRGRGRTDVFAADSVTALCFARDRSDAVDLSPSGNAAEFGLSPAAISPAVLVVATGMVTLLPVEEVRVRLSPVPLMPRLVGTLTCAPAAIPS